MALSDPRVQGRRREHLSAVAQLSVDLQLPLHEVEAIYEEQLERLEAQATIYGYLGTLAASRTRSILRRARRTSAEAH